MIEKDKGFILKRYNFRDTSIIADIYTLRFGRITGILKGFYTLKKEFTSSLNVFTLNEFVFYPKKQQIWLVSFADLIDDYGFLSKNQMKNLIGGVFINLIHKTMPVWDPNPAIFHLLRDSLCILDKEKQAKVLYIYLIKFLTLSGFKPEFNRCIVCAKALKTDLFFSVSKGGLLCGGCYRKVDDAHPISKQSSSSLIYIQNNDLRVALRLNISFDCEKEIFYLLRKFISYHLEFDPMFRLTPIFGKI